MRHPRHRTSIHTLLGKHTRLAAVLVACCVLVVLLAGCGPAGQPSVARSSRAASTPPPRASTPQVVFQADWTHGAGDWHLPPHWTLVDGALVSDGYATQNVPVPYTVTATRYRVEMTARVVDVTVKRTSYNNYFGILALDDRGARQFEAESIGFGPLPFHGDSWLIGADGTSHAWELTIGSNARTYRVDVYGKQVVFYPGGSGSIGGVTNAQGNTPAHLYIEASQVQVVITKFVIMTI